MSTFVDQVSVRLKAGDGGDGCVSFHREKFVQQGGPDGGDGGRGGDICFVASSDMHTLLDFRYRREFKAQLGEDGRGRKQSGKNGENTVIAVPVGTVIRDAETGKVALDMITPNETRRLLRGGRGGHGNTHFATPTRQAPNFAKPGEKTREIEALLELKSIADVGLVGFPNVGKSTLLSVVTTARPKIANYHFTTLTPNLGIVKSGGDSFILADIPGLIEGAAGGAGLGHAFLRHVERTRLIIHVLDISGSEGRDPLNDYDIIMDEMRGYGDLAGTPMIIAANKCDLPDSDEHIERLKAHIGGEHEIFAISAATRMACDELMLKAVRMLRDIPPREAFVEEDVFIEDGTGEDFVVAVEKEAFHVTGPGTQRLINSVNFDDVESMLWFHRTLRRLGVIDKLRASGAKEGATVVFGDMEFDFVD